MPCQRFENSFISPVLFIIFFGGGAMWGSGVGLDLVLSQNFNSAICSQK